MFDRVFKFRKIGSVLCWVLLLATYAPAQVRAVGAVGFTVSDVDRSAEFFAKVLSFEKVSEYEVLGPEYEHLTGVFGARARIVRMRLGAETIELTEYLAPKGRAIPADMRSNDRAFQHIAIIVSDMDKAYAWLRQHKVQHASTGPQTLPEWNKSAAGIKAFYFRDPDGHFLEILSFPAGKGLPRWQDKTRLFLGIDHTAIVVTDTDASLRFYRDLLGLRIAGESENYGTEQEHLNNVFGARLRITALRAENGPGIEFLEYVAPSDGRLSSSDLRANDLVFWQTQLITKTLPQVVERARKEKFAVTGGIVKHEGRNAAYVRDADGHTMALIAEGN
jgi:catechol 2,3-dioxygenase-like lactoylglutathione lyase family enzyme